MTDPLHDRVRVLDHKGITWTVREMEPLPDELDLDQCWLVFTPQSGALRRIPMLRFTFALLSNGDLVRMLETSALFS